MLEQLKSLPDLDLPNVNGQYTFDAPLAPLTWFQVGGAAKVLFKPKDICDLAYFLKNLSKNIPYFILGAGSNILIRDGGYDGVVIKLGRNFSKIELEDGLLVVGAAALDRSVAMTALTYSIKGLEFLVTIPGSIGGAIAMNAGCYDREIKDILVWAEVIDKYGNIFRLDTQQLNMTYRKSDLPKGCIIIRAAFIAEKGDSVKIQYKIQEHLKLRADSQPTKCKTGGSTFKNPSLHKAWELIDKAGCRGLSLDAAQMSEKHCNFMINNGVTRSYYLEELGELVRKKVKANSGLDLEWEIIMVGDR